MIITLIFILVIFGGLIAWNFIRAYFISRFFATFQPPPISISAKKATLHDWQDYLPTIGVLKAVNTVDVTAETSGLVTHIFFESGNKVTRGTSLVQLDDLAEQQDLNNQEAELELAKLTSERLRSLIKSHATSQAELDQAQAKLKQSQAQVQKTKVLIDQKLIKAPFTGKLGIRDVNLGQYVSAGTKLVSLESMNPLYLNFAFPEQHLNQLYLGQIVELFVDVYPNKPFFGKVTAVDSKSNQNTHNILIQATVPNDDEKLYPGLFANVKAMLPLKHKVILVPQTAVTYSLYGDSVYIVVTKGKDKDKDGKPLQEVVQKYVTVGKRFGDQVIIEKGLKEGDMVVTSGQLKLQNGSHVLINNTVDI